MSGAVKKRPREWKAWAAPGYSGMSPALLPVLWSSKAMAVRWLKRQEELSGKPYLPLLVPVRIVEIVK